MYDAIPIQTKADQDPEFELAGEAALIAAAQSGEAGFTALYLRWVTPIYKYLYSRVQNAPVAEDLTSQVFLRAYEKLPAYQHRGRFAAWLFTIARNLAMDDFRQARQELSLDEQGDFALDLDPLAQTIHRDELERLMQLVWGLSEQELELIRLRYVAELSYAEIGALIGKRDEAVRKAISRLLARLEQQLEADHA